MTAFMIKNYVESLIQPSSSSSSSPTSSSSQAPEKLLDNLLHMEPSDSSVHSGLYRTLSDNKDKRKKLESEDSSYDSDYELSWISKSHEDVSRTYSDTLASEFCEYVSLSKEPEQNDYSTSSDPDYTGKVEFALRLGYPEGLLIKALRKLGPSAGQDKILAELIRLQNSKPMPPVASVVDLEKPLEESSSSMTQAKTSVSSGEESEASFLPIVIDGSNVAMSHGNKEVFSCRGIQLCVNWFMEKGLRNITVFVPRWRKESSKPESPISDQHILTELEKDRVLTYTPSRQVGGRRVVCHDDRYILNLAAETGAIVVSNDNYRELLSEKPEYKDVITKRILMYSFVNDRFMPPDDPMGKNGPTLLAFLRGLSKNLDIHQSVPCPYGKKCTYGNKCKYYHAERGNVPQKSITDKLKETSSQRINEVRSRVLSRDSSPGDPLTRTVSVNIPPRIQEKQRLCRTQSNIPSRAFDRSHSKPFLSNPQQQQSFDCLSLCPPPCLSIPPPGPWQAPSPPSPPRRHSTTSYQVDSGSPAHLKLSRQLSLHPCYDGRLQRFLCPPPLPSPHQSVSRNASAPECFINPPTRHLHKTVSDGINYGQFTQAASSRQKLFIHLVAIFPEKQVLQALSALPDETDGQKICEYIISMNSK